MAPRDSDSAARTCLIVLAIGSVLLLIVCAIAAISVLPVSIGSDSSTDATIERSTQAAGTNPLIVSVMDVGQGMSVAVVTPDGHAMVIDSGRSTTRMEDWVVPYLRANGVEELDYVVLSHPDQDHIGGLPALLDLLPVRALVDPVIPNTNQTYEALLNMVQRLGIEPIRARRGTQLDLGPLVSVEVIWPPEVLLQSGGEPERNNNSLVIRIEYGEIVVLVPADAEIEAEMALIELDKIDGLRADALVVGHHGSQSSSSSAFLDVVAPTVAIIPVGFDNQYGHPHDEVIQRLRLRGIDIYRTDLDGTVELIIDGEALQVNALGTESNR